MQASEIGQHLGSGERLLWSGRPRQGLRLQASDTFLIPSIENVKSVYELIRRAQRELG